jgi:monoamine oxidase
MPAVDDDDDDEEDVIAPLPPARKRHDVKFSDCEMRPSQANAAKTKTANAAKTKTANAAKTKTAKVASAKWCAVSIADEFDGELIPGVLLDAKEYVKKVSDAKLRAVRLLNSNRVLLLPPSNCARYAIHTDAKTLRETCDRMVLVKNAGKTSTELMKKRQYFRVLAPALPPKPLHDVLETNEEFDAPLNRITWWDGDVYVFAQARKDNPQNIDKSFIRIDRTTGEKLKFTNCSATGEVEIGTHMNRLRSNESIRRYLDRARVYAKDLRKRWKRVYDEGGQRLDVPSTLPELTTTVSAVVVENGVPKDALASTTMKVIKSKPVTPKRKLSADDLETKATKKKCDVNDAVKKPVPKKRIEEKPAKPVNVPWGGNPSPVIVVVGAGPAGLAAARSLKNHGASVVVLESRSRPGGRCNTVEMREMASAGLPSVQVDLGASFIHGCHDYNPVYAIAKKHKVALNTAGGGYSAGWGEKSSWYNAEGGRVKEQDVAQAFQISRKATEIMFIKNAEDIERSLCVPIKSTQNEQLQAQHFIASPSARGYDEIKENSDCSLEDAFNYATNQIVNSLLNGKKRFEKVKPVYDSIPVITWAFVAPMRELSFVFERNVQDEIRDILAPDGPVNANETSDVESESDASTVDSAVKRPPGKVENKQLDFSDGMVVNGYKDLLIDRLIGEKDGALDIKYEHVVNRVKVDETSFMNEFGQQIKAKQKSYCVTCTNGTQHPCDYVVVTVPLGVLKKNRIEFTPPLSDQKLRAIQRIGMGTENKVYMRFKEMFWPKSKFFQVTDPRYRFLNLDAYGKKHTLLAHVAPPYAHDFDGKDELEIVRGVCRVLQKMFRLKSLPVPDDYIVTNWGNDEHSFGAYSYARTGTTVLDVEALAAPEHDGRLYFAGEACSITGPQCVHGAVVTGNAAAVNILSLGNVDIDVSKIVGGDAGMQEDEEVNWKQCHKCSVWRKVPSVSMPIVEDNSLWECADGGVWNTYLAKEGCKYSDESKM